MTNTFSELILMLSAEGSDPVELDDMTSQLRREILELEVESVDRLSGESTPQGAKAAVGSDTGQIAITLAPGLISPLFALLRSWIARKPSTPVEIKIRVGRMAAPVEYDPTNTTAEELEALVKTLKRSSKK